MSIPPGTTVIKDPDAEKVYTFDWSAWLVGPALIASSEFIVSEIDGDTAPLAFTDDEILSGSLTTQLLLIGGKLGKTYTVTNRVVTNESPAQTEDASIKVKIAAQ